MIAFFDSSALIYLIEGNEPFSTKIRKELAIAAKDTLSLVLVCRA